MAKGKRLYLPEPADPAQEVYDLHFPGGDLVRLGDFGQRLKIGGVLFQGEGTNILVMTPTGALDNALMFLKAMHGDHGVQVADVNKLSEWAAIIAQTDDPVFFEKDPSGMVKAVHRKVRYSVSVATQQAVWARDGFRCMYCGEAPPERVITVDHFVPLEHGGVGTIDNLLTSCAQCNRAKGSMLPAKFCADRGLDMWGLEQYLAGKCSARFVGHLVGKG